jgi:hypothetical protein
MVQRGTARRSEVIAEIVHRPADGIRVIPVTDQDRAASRLPEAVFAAVADLLDHAAVDAIHAAVATRAIRALAATLGQAGVAALASAGGAATDRDALIDVLLEAPDPDAAPAADPLARARLRGDRRRQALLAADGGVLGVAEVARRLALTRQAVDRRRATGRLLAVSAGRHGYRYPAWQFDVAGPLPGLAPVLAALRAGDHDPWMQLAFFVEGRTDLDGRRPLDLLRAGEIAPVVVAARRLGEHGAT